MSETSSQSETISHNTQNDSQSPVESAAELVETERINENDLPPQRDEPLLPVIGLGGSAGSIGALQEFFGRIPTNLGIAYVVVVHLAADYESQLPSILQARTRMPVVQVQGSVMVEPNHVYVIPPAFHLRMDDGHIHLSQPEQDRGRRVAVDLFFRTLAATHRSRAVAVVLSGTDGDGAIGIKRIKEHGGVTIAQDPAEADHEGMPRSAIETGMVDWILPVEQMVGKIAEWIGNERRIKLPLVEDNDQAPPASREEADEMALREVLAFLHTRTGHDFSHYKRATVLRRIMRRLQVNSLENLPQYATFLRTHPGEAGALLQDLLISVTNFFRDPESFLALSAMLPRLFRDKQPNDTVRVWVPGCATGEEAYSLAMMLDEYAETLGNAPEIQIFASDLDDQALRFAREGNYPGTIAADVSPERLRRYFVQDQGRYRVKKELRERVLFAAHNLLKDSPFSRLDLVSCRNLLIYFGRDAQDKVLDVFHFALRNGGLLFLGGSESADESAFFAVQDKKHRIYARQAAVRTHLPSLDMAMPPVPRVIETTRFTHATAPPVVEVRPEPRPSVSYGDLHLRLLEQVAPPSVLVNANYEILHLSENAGRFLRLLGGEATTNLLSLVHPSLRLELRAALFRALQSGEDVNIAPMSVEMDGQVRSIGVRVRPLREEDSQHSSFILVIFDEPKNAPQAMPAPIAPDEGAQRLEAELQHLKTQLRVSIEQYEASTEELKASNEELQAMNEEQRSAGEELETSREEIQAANEELITLNSELKAKVEEVSRANSDLQNLMASTDIATIFLTRDLRIKRYTPAAVDLFRIIPTDIGRPLGDLRHGFGTQTLTEDADRVLRTLATVEREVTTENDQWFLLRVSPYRTIEDRIDGVVLSFIDITARRHMEEELRRSEDRLQKALSIETVGVLFFNNAIEITDCNDAFLRMSGYTREEILAGKFSWEAFTPDGFVEASSRAIAEMIASGIATPYEKEYVRKDGTRFWAVFAAKRISENEIVEFVTDITEQKRAEALVRESEEKYRTLFDSIDEGFVLSELIYDANGQAVDYRYLEVNRVFERQTGLKNVTGKIASEIDTIEPLWLETYDRVARTGEPVRFENYNQATGRWYASFASRVGGASSRRIINIFDDITERKRREANLAFLAEVTQDLAHLKNIDETMDTLGAKIGAYFNVARVVFGEISENQETEHVSHEWHQPDLPSMKGFYAAQEYFSREFEHLHRAGEIAVVRDVAYDERVDSERYAALGVGAFVSVPLIRQGKWHFYVSLLDSKPRNWGDDEIELLRELSARIWLRLESARAERALIESEGRLRTLIKNLPGGAVFVVDKNLRYLLASGEALEGAGLKPEDLVGRTIFEALSPELAHDYEPNYRKALAGESFSVEHQAHGHTYITRGMPLTNVANEIYAVLAVSYDITDRKRAEEELRASEEQFRVLFEQATAGVAEMDLEGNNTLVNQKLCEMLGYSEAELLSKNVRELAHPDDLPLCLELFENLIRTGLPYIAEKRLICKAGEVIWVSESISLINDLESEAQRIVTISIDISERKAAEDALRQAHEELEARVLERTAELEANKTKLEEEIAERRRTEKAREQLMQRIVTIQEEERHRISRELHDQMGQQLTALLMGMQTLPEWPEPGLRSPSFPQQIAKLRGMVSGLIGDVQRLAWEMRPAALDNLGLEVALLQYVEEWSTRCQIPAHFVESNQSDTNVVPEAMATALYRVTQEALTNVQRHAQAKNVSVVLEKTKSHISIIVEDDGKGFDPDKDENGQERSTAQRLGLLGMQERLELVGGTLTIESAPQKGTSLYARVPMKIDAKEDAENPTS